MRSRILQQRLDSSPDPIPKDFEIAKITTICIDLCSRSSFIGVSMTIITYVEPN